MKPLKLPPCSLRIKEDAGGQFVYDSLRRADILIHDRAGEPVMIVECKAPAVKINQEVFDQVINYNFNYGVGYLVVTNGITHYAGKIDRLGHSFTLLDHIPDYKTISMEQP